MHDKLRLSLDKSQGILANSRIVYLMLYANDLEASRAFYEVMLGLRLIEADKSSAKYDTGQTILCLNRAADYGVKLARRDYTADLTFLVDNLDGVRATLAKRGVEFSETLRYEIGATVNFYDPDGRSISLYEPSTVAMSWPSGEKIRAVSTAGGKSAKGYGGAGSGLEGRELIYLFLFVPDAEVAFDFYHGALGLHHLECRPCRRGSTDHERGVVKYDAGGIMLTTHLSQSAGQPPEVGALQRKGIAPVYHVTDVEAVVEALAQKAIHSGGVVQSESGVMARFEDPFGRVFYLHEPFLDTLQTRRGAKLAQILAARL